jgi:MoaA/NifB/PqqE/SkfB family radical SAM enzyme
VVSLHNWGEPILHPDLNGIVSALNARGLRIAISTNASKKTSFTVPTHGFDVVTFSVPGWSQASYDKVHQLRFDRVVANMEGTMQNMRAMGYKGDFTLAYHVYQFNVLDELEEARAWCSRNGVVFHPYFAYINDYLPAKAYIKGELALEALAEMSKTLFLHYVDDLVAQEPDNWKCPQWTGQLTLNHRSQVLLCCVLPYDHEAAVLGSVFELSRDQILSGKVSSRECGDCLGCGVAYWVHNPLDVTTPAMRAAAEHAQAVTERDQYKEIAMGLSSAGAPRALRMVLPLARKLRQGYNLLRRH